MDVTQTDNITHLKDKKPACGIQINISSIDLCLEDILFSLQISKAYCLAVLIHTPNDITYWFHRGFVRLFDEHTVCIVWETTM